MSEYASSWPAAVVVEAARDGDRRALATLIAGSQPHVQRFASRLCATQEDAEDAAQEALLVLYRQIGTLRATAALASWMFRIVRNECLRQAFFTRKQPSITAAVSSRSAEEQLLARLEGERVVDAIASLPSDQREVLVLRDVQGYSGAATAEALGLSKAAMKSRLHRARIELRANLGEPPASPVGST